MLLILNINADIVVCQWSTLYYLHTRRGSICSSDNTKTSRWIRSQFTETVVTDSLPAWYVQHLDLPPLAHFWFAKLRALVWYVWRTVSNDVKIQSVFTLKIICSSRRSIAPYFYCSKYPPNHCITNAIAICIDRKTALLLSSHAVFPGALHPVTPTSYRKQLTLE